MHKEVWRYLELEEKLDSPDFLSRLSLVADLVLQPLGHVLFWVCFMAFPALLTRFGYSETPTKLRFGMYIVSSLQVFARCIKSWSEMIEFYNLGTLFLVTHIRHCRTPFQYTIKSGRPSHQLFRYAALTASAHP